MPNKTVTVRRFEILFYSGSPTMARLLFYENAGDKNGFSIGTSGKTDPQNAIVQPAILALASAWPKVPKSVQLEVNEKGEIITITIS